MLKQESINSAVGIVDVISDENLAVSPVVGSPLAFLNASMIAVPESETLSDDVFNMAAGRSGNVAHEQELEAFAKLMKKKVSGLHAFARNSVNPLIKDILEKFSQQKAEIENAQPIKLNIVPVEEHHIRENWKLASVLSPWENETFDQTPKYSEETVNLINGFVTHSSFVECAKTGDETLDDFIASIVTEEFNVQDWQRPRDLQNLANAFLNHKDIAYLFFIRGIIAGRLPDFPVDQLSSADRDALTTSMRLFGQSVITRFKTVDNFYNRSSEFDFFISSQETTLYVLHSKYTNWISDNGSIEAIFGAVMEHGNSSMAVSQAVSDPNTYVELYAHRMRYKETMDKGQVRALLETITINVLTSWINLNDKIEDEKRAGLHKRLAELVEETPFTFTEQEHNWVRRVVCKTVGSDLYLFELLDCMESFMTDNEEADVEEAAIYATAFVMAKWLAGQMVVTKEGKSLFNL